jgi:hypothetical protein
MNCHARIVTESQNASAVAGSLNVDNVALGCLKIKSAVLGGKVVTEIDANSIGTMLATIDDVLRCQITSEGLITDGH